MSKIDIPHNLSIIIREIFKHLITLWPFPDCSLIWQYPSLDRITGPCAVVHVRTTVYINFYFLLYLPHFLVYFYQQRNCEHLFSLNYPQSYADPSLCTWRSLSQEQCLGTVRLSSRCLTKISEMLLCSCAKGSTDLSSKMKWSVWLHWSEPAGLCSPPAGHNSGVLFPCSVYYSAFLYLAHTSLHFRTLHLTVPNNCLSSADWLMSKSLPIYSLYIEPKQMKNIWALSCKPCVMTGVEKRWERLS